MTITLIKLGDSKLLNKGQKKAVEMIDGVVSCTASAGSGKTFALIHRVKNMIEKGIEPERIMISTFTKKAGNELQERLKNLLAVEKVDRLTVGTMHSVFYSVLREEMPFIDPDFSKVKVIPEWKQKKFIKDAFQKFVGDQSEAKNPQIAMSNISRAKNELMTPVALRKYLEVHEQDHMIWITQIYGEYERLKKEEKHIDFDDMLIMTFNLFKQNPDILKRWAKKWDYVLVDEFQDTNTAQFQIVKMLVDNGKGNLFIIGDEKQAIYGFRGARPEYVVNIQDHFPQVKKINLDITYRCHSNIMEVANKLAKKMNGHEAISHNDGGEVFYLGHFADEDEEAEQVAIEVKELLDKKIVAPKEIKILYRTNSQSRGFEEALARLNIPYVIFGGLSFFDRKEIKDMIAYLKIIENPEREEESYIRVINRPTRMLGKAFLQQWANNNVGGSDCLDALICSYSYPYMEKNAKKLYQQLKRVIYKKGTAKNVGELVAMIRADLGYDEWLLKDEFGDKEEDSVEKPTDILDEFMNFAFRFESVESLLNYISLLSDNGKDKENSNAVQLMTIHKSKGLEAEAVFVGGVSQGLLPHFRGDLAEERRLAYVAFTRAKKILVVSSFELRNKKSMDASIFLNETKLLSDELIEEVKEDEL